MNNPKVTLSRVVLTIFVSITFFLCACCSTDGRHGNSDWDIKIFFATSVLSAWALIGMLTDIFTFLGTMGKRIGYGIAPRKKA